MNCNVVKDLIPLYIDGCCSEESATQIKEHLSGCKPCRKLFEDMNTPSETIAVSKVPVKLRKLNDWKASVLQSVLLFLSFGLITIGVALEAQTPYGLLNGFWAQNLVIPATGFMLSLANWYFVRLYRSRKSFSNYSLLATLGITVCAYIWAIFHYELELFGLPDFAESLHALLMFNGMGLLLTAVFCVLSKTLSAQYAKMLGKE